MLKHETVSVLCPGSGAGVGGGGERELGLGNGRLYLLGPLHLIHTFIFLL